MEYQLLEDFLNGQATDIERHRIELIRVLSRSGTLPKVVDLQVQYIHSQPEMFLMDPGKQLRIGIRLLEHPVLALLALRYGLEWHIWYKAMKGFDIDCRIADLAAAKVALSFIELLPDDDRKALDEVFPEDLKALYRKMRQSAFHVSDFENLNSWEIQKFHKLDYPQGPINKAWLAIVEHLAVPTEALLMSGGDQRQNIDTATLLNKYGCRPFPRPEAYTFASSTATSVSNIAFDLTQKHREKLIKESFRRGLHDAYLQQQNEIINRLKSVLNLGRQTSVITAPSGTDISLLFAGICQVAFKKPITHILVASDETGSGVPLALEGKHFADTSALMKPVTKGDLVDGFREVRVEAIPLRKSNGSLKSCTEIDQEVYAAITLALNKGEQPVLHVMDQSKLGYAAPTEGLLEQTRQEFGSDLLVMVDNSQLRMQRKRIQAYIKKGYVMTLTGSKFFTGPPFSGALIIPPQLHHELTALNKALPLGLGDYYYRADVNVNAELNKTLAKGFNIGSQLRWQAALAEMERYYRVPLSLRNLGSELFCQHVAKRIANSTFLEALHEHENEDQIPLAEEDRTIVPFFIKRDGNMLSHEETDKLYRLLNRDISQIISEATDEEKRIARQACHIGQPVKVVYKDGKPGAVVRISLGSRVIAESWKDRDVSIFFQRIEGQMNQVDTVVKKIELILKHQLV
jgi:hypothetical protein